MWMQYLQVWKYNNALYPDLPNGGYLFGEKVYQFLSLFTKSLILWQVSAAAFSPSWNDIEQTL
jgi:hypothetical protein